MGKNKDPSPRKRGKIEVLLQQGNMTQREIAKHVGLSQKAVHSIKTRLDFSNTSLQNVHHVGENQVLHLARNVFYLGSVEIIKNSPANSCKTHC